MAIEIILRHDTILDKHGSIIDVSVVRVPTKNRKPHSTRHSAARFLALQPVEIALDKVRLDVYTARLEVPDEAYGCARGPRLYLILGDLPIGRVVGDDFAHLLDVFCDGVVGRVASYLPAIYQSLAEWMCG